MKPFVLGIAFILGLGAVSAACDQCQKQAAVGQPVAVCPQVQAVQAVQTVPVQQGQAVQAMPVQTVQTVQTVHAMPVQTVALSSAVCVNACAKQGRNHPVQSAIERRNQRADARRAARGGGGCHGTAVALVTPVAMRTAPSCSGSGQPLSAEAPDQPANSGVPPAPDLR